MKKNKLNEKQLTDVMVERHLAGELSVRDIEKLTNIPHSTVHRYIAKKIKEFLPSYENYVLSRAKYQALRNLDELLDLKGSRDHLRKEMTLKTLEGLGVFVQKKNNEINGGITIYLPQVKEVKKK